MLDRDKWSPTNCDALNFKNAVNETCPAEIIMEMNNEAVLEQYLMVTCIMFLLGGCGHGRIFTTEILFV